MKWQAPAADEQTQVAIMPFVGFIDSGPDQTFEPVEDIDDRLDDAAAQILGRSCCSNAARASHW